MVKATKPRLDILQSCSVLASHWVKDIEFESMIAVIASVFALKIAHAELVVQCIYATAVFVNEGPALTVLYGSSNSAMTVIADTQVLILSCTQV